MVGGKDGNGAPEDEFVDAEEEQQSAAKNGTHGTMPSEADAKAAPESTIHKRHDAKTDSVEKTYTDKIAEPPGPSNEIARILELEEQVKKLEAASKDDAKKFTTAQRLKDASVKAVVTAENKIAALTRQLEAETQRASVAEAKLEDSIVVERNLSTLENEGIISDLRCKIDQIQADSASETQRAIRAEASVAELAKDAEKLRAAKDAETERVRLAEASAMELKGQLANAIGANGRISELTDSLQQLQGEKQAETKRANDAEHLLGEATAQLENLKQVQTCGSDKASFLEDVQHSQAKASDTVAEAPLVAELRKELQELQVELDLERQKNRDSDECIAELLNEGEHYKERLDIANGRIQELTMEVQRLMCQHQGQETSLEFALPAPDEVEHADVVPEQCDHALLDVTALEPPTHMSIITKDVDGKANVESPDTASLHEREVVISDLGDDDMNKETSSTPTCCVGHVDGTEDAEVNSDARGGDTDNIGSIQQIQSDEFDAESNEELLSNLDIALRDAKLDHKLLASLQWCEEQGCTSMQDILRQLDGFTKFLDLKPLQQKRLLRVLQSLDYNSRGSMEQCQLASPRGQEITLEASTDHVLTENTDQQTANGSCKPLDDMTADATPQLQTPVAHQIQRTQSQDHHQSDDTTVAGKIEPVVMSRLPSSEHARSELEECKDWLPIFEAALEEAKLGPQSAAAKQWCTDRGVASMQSVITSFDDLVHFLQLKPLQAKRFQRVLQKESLPSSNDASQNASITIGKAVGMSRAKSSGYEAEQGKREENTLKRTNSCTKPKFAFLPPTAAEATVPRSVRLRVHRSAGAGLDLRTTWYGMIIECIEDVPGQPDLEVGDCIIELAGSSLQELDISDCEAAFADALRDRAKAIVETHCEARGCLPDSVNMTCENMRKDLEAFGLDYEVSFSIQATEKTLVMSGPRPAVAGARIAATALINKWVL